MSAHYLRNAHMEREFAAGLLLNPECISSLCEAFSPGDISDPPLRLVCEAVLGVEQPDPTSVVAHLKTRGGTKQVDDWSKFVADLMKDAPLGGAFLSKQARHLHDLAALRAAGSTMRTALEGLGKVDCTSEGEAARFLETTAAKLETLGSSQRADSELITVCAADVHPEKVDWLWRDRYPMGRVSMLLGDPGLGKSLNGIDACARVTKGLPWPDGATPPPIGSVVLLMAEDDPGDTIRPRLDAAGADPSKVHIIQGARKKGRAGAVADRMFSLRDDLSALGNLFENLGDVQLLVVDPINAYLGSGIDSYKDAEVRAVLGPLAELARQHSVAVLCVTHLNKAGASKAIYRGLGSIGFVASARAVWLVTKDPEDEERRFFLPIKSNLGPDPHGLAYRVRAECLGDAPYVAWEEGAVTETADAILTKFSAHDSGKAGEAKTWLARTLADGPVRGREVIASGEEQGFSDKMIRQASNALGICKRTDGFQGPSIWELPKDGQANDVQELPSPKSGATLGESGQHWTEGVENEGGSNLGQGKIDLRHQEPNHGNHGNDSPSPESAIIGGDPEDCSLCHGRSWWRLKTGGPPVCAQCHPCIYSDDRVEYWEVPS